MADPRRRDEESLVMVEACVEAWSRGSHRFTSWEGDFLADMETRVDAGMPLTPRQYDKLEQLYREKVSDA